MLSLFFLSLLFLFYFLYSIFLLFFSLFFIWLVFYFICFHILILYLFILLILLAKNFDYFMRMIELIIFLYLAKVYLHFLFDCFIYYWSNKKNYFVPFYSFYWKFCNFFLNVDFCNIYNKKMTMNMKEFVGYEFDLQFSIFFFA